MHLILNECKYSCLHCRSAGVKRYLRMLYYTFTEMDVLIAQKDKSPEHNALTGAIGIILPE